MTRRLPPILLFLLCASGAAPAQPAPDASGLAKTPVRKIVAAPKPLAVEGAKGAENFCAAVAASAASTRLAWQEARVKALQADLITKIVELDAKAAEVRDWVAKREQLLDRASESLIAIYTKMKPEAASAQVQAMDDDTAAALLLKLKPAVASAVMSEMEFSRAARLTELLTGAAPKSPEPRPPAPQPQENKS